MGSQSKGALYRPGLLLEAQEVWEAREDSTAPSSGARTIMAFDTGWLFNVGDPANAQATTFADSGWRALNVPHDWSIEGATPPSNPFSQTAATTGRGAYAPSGVAWYRKHFTLPAGASGDKLYIEFDGVMANASFYVNGTLLGEHPYGYVSLRYDMTAAVTFGGADNVVAVRCDTSLQPAERFYTGAGIYRHVRVIETNPVHVDQWATYIQTPAPTATSATVNVQTTVLNTTVSGAPGQDRHSFRDSLPHRARDGRASVVARLRLGRLAVQKLASHGQRSWNAGHGLRTGKRWTAAA